MPLSACPTASNTGRSRYGPTAPKPVIEQWINRGFRSARIRGSSPYFVNAPSRRLSMQHIAVVDQRQQGRPVALAAEVDDDAAFVAIDGDEVRAVLPAARATANTARTSSPSIATNAASSSTSAAKTRPGDLAGTDRQQRCAHRQSSARSVDEVRARPTDFAQRNPRLIHCSITGFGAVGHTATARCSMGRTGAERHQPSPVDPKSPFSSGPTIPDDETGMSACLAILGALYDRAQTGHGHRVEVNMLEALMAFIPGRLHPFHAEWSSAANHFTRVSASQSFVFRCADGKLLAVHLSTGEVFWKSWVTRSVLEAAETRQRSAFHQACRAK